MEVPQNQGARQTSLVQCNRCNLVFEEPRPPREEIEQFYSQKELWTNSRDAEGSAHSYVDELNVKKPLFENLAKRIQGRKSGGRLLDVGSGPGLLELVLTKPAWEVTGVEFASYIAEFGRQTLHTTVLNMSFVEADLPENYYDVIVLKYVLDHMEEPFEALTKARRLIKPDGILVVADLINIESFCARFFRQGYRLIHPMHFTYFSPRTIQLHLGRAGFSVTKIEFPYFSTPYFTLAHLTSLAGRVLHRVAQRSSITNGERIYSAPFYGNMMDVWAAPAL